MNLFNIVISYAAASTMILSGHVYASPTNINHSNNVINTHVNTFSNYKNENKHIYHNGNIDIALSDNYNTNQDIWISYQRVNEIANLPDNWNDNGANRFSKELIKKVQFILLKLNIQPFISPTGRDSIQMEYEFDDGRYLEFEVFESNIKHFERRSDGSFYTEYCEIEKMIQIVSEIDG